MSKKIPKMLVFTTDDFITDQTKPIYDKKDLLCVYWVHNQQKKFHLLMEDRKILMNTEVKIWKKQIKQKKLQVLKGNCVEITCRTNDRKFYALTIQPLDEDGELLDIRDPFALLMFGRHVTGITYFFTIKKNKDMIFEYITR